jgi:hypothetical protein
LNSPGEAWLNATSLLGPQGSFSGLPAEKLLPPIPFASRKIQLVPLKRSHFCIRLWLFAILISNGNSTKRVLEKRMIPKETPIETDTIFTNGGVTPNKATPNPLLEKKPDSFTRR